MKTLLYSAGAVLALLLASACSSDDDGSDGSTSTTKSSGSTVTNFVTSGTNIALVDTALDDNEVTVTWGDSATVAIAANLYGLVTAYKSGDYVSVLASDDITEQVTYTLSGSSNDGGFYMDGSYKAKYVLNGLTLTAQDDNPALQIDNGKRLHMKLADGTTNRLTDSNGASHKACVMLNGHSEWDGEGTLTIQGNSAHALWADEYMLVEEGTITVSGAVTDGFNINQYYKQSGGTVTITGVGDDGIAVAATDDSDDEYNGQIILSGGTATITITASAAKGMKCESDMTINGGTYTISTSGNGTYDSEERDAKGCACLRCDGNFTMNGGTLSLSSSGTGGKGINADGTLAITGGTVTVKTTGKQYTYTNNITASAKGIKSDGAMTLDGGTINVSTTGGTGSEGIEGKAAITISDGSIYVYAYDDAINAAKNLIISGGQVYAQSTGNDGLDANNNIYINGGDVIAIGGSTSVECAIDAAEGYSVYVNGGNLFAVGASSEATSSSSSQPSIEVNASVSGKAISLGTSSTPYLYMQVPSTSCKYVLMSCPSLVKGTTYYLKSGASYSGTTWNGLGTDASLITAGSSSLTSATAAYSVGSGTSTGGGTGGGTGPGNGRW